METFAECVIFHGHSRRTNRYENSIVGRAAEKYSQQPLEEPLREYGKSINGQPFRKILDEK
jgi:hypothetical protein